MNIWKSSEHLWILWGEYFDNLKFWDANFDVEPFLISPPSQNAHAQEVEEDPLAKLKGQKLVSCRICKGDHWTTRCPYKDTLGPLQEELTKDPNAEAAPGGVPAAPGTAAAPAAPAAKATGKYVPPSLREGASRRGPGESMHSNKRGELKNMQTWCSGVRNNMSVKTGEFMPQKDTS